MFETPKDWYFAVSLVISMTTFIAMLLFGRLSMAGIEKRIKQDGLPRPCPWDGPGARIVWYAYAIGLPVGRFNRADDPMINVGLVRKYATSADRIRAVVLLVFSNLFLVNLFVGVLAFDI
ncbi:hypothetical protein [Marinimicrobium sp. C6131]|uniref:hypothetical protein n=1 Tax=Marinimicrobium TaxID=359337 RepID=UPI00223D978C|nr:hypothetical protein [Marinimicrobium sp. C6131]UZJ46018.1 hypothetical protein OOT55_08205 [Marinimicrobium sp. C6131]